jgi:PhnB protein
MQVVPYLNFNGNCREAFEFYAECLGGKLIAMFKHSDMPAGQECPGDWQDLIMHARIDLGEGQLMASDSPPDQYQKPQGLWVSLHPQTPEEAERIFHALAEGGDVLMPIQETFWAVRFAMVTDRFGTPWMINCEKAG